MHVKFKSENYKCIFRRQDETIFKMLQLRKVGAKGGLCHLAVELIKKTPVSEEP